MLRDKEFPVYGDNGFRGTLFAPARFLDKTTQKRVRLEDGREIFVSADELESKPDGSFYLRNAEGLTARPSSRQPDPPAAAAPFEAAPAEAEHFERAPVEEPVPQRASPPAIMTGNSFQGEALFREDCEVKRVPVRRFIETPAQSRQEGDTLIVPLMEEVLVLEKRLLLREELHITRKREANPNPVPQRREEFEQDR